MIFIMKKMSLVLRYLYPCLLNSQCHDMLTNAFMFSMGFLFIHPGCLPAD